MKTILLAAIFIPGIIIFSSCQKEIDPNILNEKISGNPCASDLLVKIVSRTGNDSVITTFEYDGTNRLIRQVINPTVQGSPGSSIRNIIRDRQGIITQVLDKVDNRSDSSLRNVFYNSNTGRYTHTTEEFYPYGLLLKDSIVFIYDAAGKIVKEDLYLDHFTNGTNYTLENRSEFIYDGAGNITMEKFYSRDQVTNVIEFDGTLEFSYDNKNSANQVDKGEAFIIYDPSSLSAHNRTLIKLTNFTFPIYDVTDIEQYTYNSCDRPVMAIQIQNPGNIISNVSFYYR